MGVSTLNSVFGPPLTCRGIQVQHPFTLKNFHLLIPLMALIVCVFALFFQQSEIISTKERILALQSRIAAVTDGISEDHETVPSHSWLTDNRQSAAVTKPVWKKIALELDYLNAGAAIADSVHLERFNLLSEDELLAALEEIEGMALSRNVRWSLRSLLMTSLGKINGHRLYSHAVT